MNEYHLETQIQLDPVPDDGLFIPGWLLRKPELVPAAKLLYAAIPTRDRIGREQIRDFAKRAGLPERTAFRVLDQLRSANLVSGGGRAQRATWRTL